MHGYKLKIVGWALLLATLWVIASILIVQGNKIIRAIDDTNTRGETLDVRVVNGSDDAVPVQIQPTQDEAAAQMGRIRAAAGISPASPTSH